MIGRILDMDERSWVLFAVTSFSKTAGGLFLNRFIIIISQ